MVTVSDSEAERRRQLPEGSDLLRCQYFGASGRSSHQESGIQVALLDLNLKISA